MMKEEYFGKVASDIGYLWEVLNNVSLRHQAQFEMRNCPNSTSIYSYSFLENVINIS